jgi:hypothetical protein
MLEKQRMKLEIKRYVMKIHYESLAALATDFDYSLLPRRSRKVKQDIPSEVLWSLISISCNFFDSITVRIILLA